VRRVVEFVEKPERALAEAMLVKGGYARNGGIFLFCASSYLDALALHAPMILAAATKAMRGSKLQNKLLSLNRKAFLSSPADSIDYAVMEKAERVAVAPVDLSWSDVGSWEAFYEVGPHDIDHNVTPGVTQLLDAHRCLVRSDGVRVSALGVSDLIIVATKDENLLIPRGRSQEVKVFSQQHVRRQNSERKVKAKVGTVRIPKFTKLG